MGRKGSRPALRGVPLPARRAEHALLRDVAAVGERLADALGQTFLLQGNMCCGVVRDELMVRVGPEAHEAALAQPHAREMDFTGKPMRGMVYVSSEGLDADADLEAWVAREKCA